MNKVIIMKGLIACGKSTYCRDLIDRNPGKYKRTNKDELRILLDNGKHTKGNENFVLKMRDQIILHGLAEHKDILVDDTNLDPRHETHIRELVKGIAEVEIKDFTNVPLEVCIARDAKRENPVGEKVIRGMYNKYLKPKIIRPEYNPDLMDVVLCDLDGTLALFFDKNAYSRDFENDELNLAVAEIIQGNHVILVSGRNEKYREQTIEFLEKNDINYLYLFMRKDGDDRKDVLVKREIYETYIKDNFNVKFVVDDRLSVCRYWYSLGLPLFRFGDQDADF